MKTPRISARRGGSCVRPLFHRWYQPGTGRYTRPDPLGFISVPGAARLWPYLYADANPLRFSDPLGLYTVSGPPDFKRNVEHGFQRIEDGLDRPQGECCADYFGARGIDLNEWVTPGGPPHVRAATGKLLRKMNEVNVCGVAQAGSPFTYYWVNPDCFKRPDPCAMASLLMHEMGHLARQDTADNEPRDFFDACTLSGRCVDPGRGD